HPRTHGRGGWDNHPPELPPSRGQSDGTLPPAARIGRSQQKGRTMSERMQPPPLFHDDGEAGSNSPYLLWGIWLMWLPFLIQPTITLLSLPPSLWKVVNLVGLALFTVIYLWATWREAYRLTSDTPLDAARKRGRWVPIGILTGLGILLCFVPGSLALGAFI